ncbi:hypothetical protein [Methanobrevibacter sp. DSM 116169]|uniref:hypothetical protein n=1 Tax=Methanobrevibacter sp. DSM 116169 TaxID=3242727 RepID=UPI0038FC4AFC
METINENPNIQLKNYIIEYINTEEDLIDYHYQNIDDDYFIGQLFLKVKKGISSKGLTNAMDEFIGNVFDNFEDKEEIQDIFEKINIVMSR